MSIATSTNYYSNSIVGVPQAGSDIDVMERNVTPRFAVGFGFQRADGNKYRYVQYATAVDAGVMVGGTTTADNLNSTNALVVATTTADAVANEIIKPGDIGSRYVEVTLATVANNQYAGGYFATVKDTGLGYTYRIKGNTATGTPKSTTFRMELYEKIKVKLDNTTDIAILANDYSDLGTGTNLNVIGVTQAAASANNYGWACTAGITTCLQSSTAVMGSAIVGASNGAYTVTDTTTMLTYQRLGIVVVPAGASGQFGIINLLTE